MHRFLLLTLTLLFVLTFHHVAGAQTAHADSIGDSETTRYRYLFENERFLTTMQDVEFDGSGSGQFRFKRKDSEEIVNKLQISTNLLAHVQSLFDELNFLGSTEDYQHKKDFSHLGKMTITMARGGKERTVSFNYSDNQILNKLTDIFRNIATQETRVMEIENVRSNDPISTPAQLRLLENELQSKHIADPTRVVPILQEIKMDEGVPLIARNHADRLLKLIAKGK